MLIPAFHTSLTTALMEQRTVIRKENDAQRIFQLIFVDVHLILVFVMLMIVRIWKDVNLFREESKEIENIYLSEVACCFW